MQDLDHPQTGHRTMSFGRFFRDRKGNVAPMLALSMVPILGAVSAAVDYSRANATRTAMQSALDATGLMLSKEAQGLSAADLSTKASAYFNALFADPNAQNVQLTTTMTNPSAGMYDLTIKVSATVATSFTRVLGQSDIGIAASSDVIWGIKKLNLALALDNTGSMSQSGKMTQLKAAAHSLLATLQSASTNPGDIQVSIVPFATDVNVGTGNVNAAWIDWTNWEASNGSCSMSWYHSQSSCTANGYTWTVASHSNWNGCVYDRDQNNDVLNTATVAGSPATMFRAHQASACPTSMMPLSTDWTALNDKIDAMTPTGNTNVTIGLALGWQTLTASDPFNAPADATDLDKVIVLLTDGTNTQNRWTSSSTSIDSRTQAVCTNAKAANIKIYTVRVIDGNATLLQNCATKPSMYYDVQQADQLNAVFSSIAQNLTNLRIAK